jgi:hypothetical protein
LERLAESLAYLDKRVEQMRYHQFQAQGWPIGSGMVESGNKLVVEARLKGAGMHWQRANFNPMLGLRNIISSDRWSSEWPRIAQQLRQEARERCQRLREKRHLAKSPPPLSVPAAAQQKPPVALIKEPVQQLPHLSKEIGSRKPAANHPWWHSPIGRAHYATSKPVKN